MPNPNPPRPTKIGRDITLKDYLNTTKGEHNGHGFEDYIEHRKLTKMTKSALAEYMNVGTETITKWIAAEPKVQG